MGKKTSGKGGAVLLLISIGRVAARREKQKKKDGQFWGQLKRKREGGGEGDVDPLRIRLTHPWGFRATAKIGVQPKRLEKKGSLESG